MLKNKFVMAIFLLGVAGLLAVIFFSFKKSSAQDIVTKEIQPVMGDIRLTVVTTGVVEPQNRLEIKPSIAGRIDDILVAEGDIVKKGAIIAWMSSTERAALVDAATTQGDQARQYWEEVYKKTPIIAPIDGKVIVRSFEPGQTITTSEPLLVLSDRLIVSAQFDETDIGRVQEGQSAVITLDAYPQNDIKGVVGSIAYESKLANNVTIYDVDIVPQEVPDFFRSGMSANVTVIENSKKNVLLVPLTALQADVGKKYVLLKGKGGKGVEKRFIAVGLMDTGNAEVVAGLTPEDRIIINEKKYSSVSKQESGSNPFMPSRKRSNDKNK